MRLHFGYEIQDVLKKNIVGITVYALKRFRDEIEARIKELEL